MEHELNPEEYAHFKKNLTAAKMYSLASCVMLFYDIVITFGDEVEKVWRQRFSGATILWFLNRYLPALGHIPIIISFHQFWSDEVCNRYVMYPEILKLFVTITIGIIFILRIYCIYSRSRIMLASFVLLLAAEVAVKIWAFSDGVRLPLPPGLAGCILTGRSGMGKRMMYTWVSELGFDTCVFLVTLYRPMSIYCRMRGGNISRILRTIIRDGILYYAAIFAANLLNVLMFIYAPIDLKVINASFSALITTLLVSRLMLNLRQEVTGPIDSFKNHTSRPPVMPTSVHAGRPSGIEASIVGNLGAPVDSMWLDRDSYNPSDSDLGNDDFELGHVIEIPSLS